MSILGWMIMYMDWIAVAVWLFIIYRVFSWLASKGL